MSNNNPYNQATQSYKKAEAEKTGRDLEAAVLLKSSIKMEMLAKKMKSGEKVRVQEIGDVLDANQKIWQVFLDNMMDDNFPVPQEIKNNIANLALFIFKRTNEVFLTGDPNKIDALIDINRNIATGLNKNPTPVNKDKDKTAGGDTQSSTVSSIDSSI